jgi:hypothetical protein
LVARGDVELGEDLPQVVGDGVLADEQPPADLGIRQPAGAKPRDPGLLAGEFVPGLDRVLADMLAGGRQTRARRA